MEGREEEAGDSQVTENGGPRERRGLVTDSSACTLEESHMAVEVGFIVF